ncbi:MAG: patatin family protein [Atopobiaceae bacterium]|nr:patatin family protein [Atopobiaceae bacterium]
MAQSGCALVLEGGGYRGLFTAGILDVFLEQQIGDFSSLWGTSAGALNAANFRAGHIGRYVRVSLAFRDDRRMMSLMSLARTGSIAGNDFLYGEVQNRIDPFDSEKFNRSTPPLWVVASDIMFGTPAYLPVESLPHDLPKIIASASLPGVSEDVEIDGSRYLDGGTTDSVPIEAALGLESGAHIEGYEPVDKAIVVLTREKSYRKESASELLPLLRRRYANYPYYLQMIETRPARYNAQRDRIFDLERQGKVLVLAPPVSLGLSTTERSGERMLLAYQMGRAHASERLDEIRDFLAE